MTAAARYLAVTPQGVAQCMTGPPRDLPQRLLRALVLRSAGQPWSSDELAGLLPGGEPRAAAPMYCGMMKMPPMRSSPHNLHSSHWRCPPPPVP